MKRKPIREWRVMRPDHPHYGIVVWCDPRVEHLRLYEGEWPGEAEVEEGPIEVDPRANEQLHLEMDGI